MSQPVNQPILIDTVEKLHEHFGKPPEWERLLAETVGYDTSRQLYVVPVPDAKPCHRSIDDDWES